MILSCAGSRHILSGGAQRRGFVGFVRGSVRPFRRAAVHHSGIARSVTMVVRGSSLSAGMSFYLTERIERAENIHVRYTSTVVAASGDGHLEAVEICDWPSNTRETVPAGALFIFIGASPPTAWLADDLLLDDHGFVLTGPDVMATGENRWPLERDPFLLETNVPGVFAAGDVRHGSGKRVATAVGEGAMAVMSVWQYRALMGL